MDGPVTFVDDCFVELRITGWRAKGNSGSLFSRRKDLVLCLCIPWGLTRRDESKAGNSAITFCQELRSKDLMFSLEPGWNETQELCVPVVGDLAQW